MGTPPHQIWWCLLLGRIAQLRASLPRDLTGVVQFEIARPSGEPARFHLEIRGPRSVGRQGVAASADALVRSSEEELEQLLFAERPAAGLLRISGRAELFTAFLRHLEAQPRPRSLLQLRGES